MKIIVVGAGEVGSYISEVLSKEDHDVVLIEKDEEALKEVSESLDVFSVNGDGASRRVLEEAEVSDSDLLVAVTDKDESNFISCILSKALGVKQTIARLKSPEYIYSDKLLSSSKLDIDFVINPDEVAASDIMRLLYHTASTDVAEFAGGKVEMMGFRVKEEAHLIGKMIKDVKPLAERQSFIVSAIVRGGKTIMPRGDTVLQAGDLIYFVGKSGSTNAISFLLGRPEDIPERVMIVGGNQTSCFLARKLEENKVDVKIIEPDRQVCEELSKELSKTIILNADPSDMDFLKSEGIEEIDGFVTASDNDEANILLSLLAKQFRAKRVILMLQKVVLLLKKKEFSKMVSSIGIDAVVSPRLVTVAAILSHIRKGKVVSVSKIAESEVEVIQLIIEKSSKATLRPLSEINFPRDAIIGAVIRGREVIIPKGDTKLELYDELILFVLPSAIPTVEKYFQS